MKLLDNVPQETKELILELIDNQKNGEYKATVSKSLNNIGKKYGFRWCKKGMHIEHAIEFPTSDMTGNGIKTPQAYCKACQAQDTSERNSIETDVVRGEYEEGGVFGDQVITDRQRDELNKTQITLTLEKKKPKYIINLLMLGWEIIRADKAIVIITKNN